MGKHKQNTTFFGTGLNVESTQVKRKSWSILFRVTLGGDFPSLGAVRKTPDLKALPSADMVSCV